MWWQIQWAKRCAWWRWQPGWRELMMQYTIVCWNSPPIGITWTFLHYHCTSRFVYQYANMSINAPEDNCKADILSDQEKGVRIYFGAYAFSLFTHYLATFYRFSQCSSRLRILCGLNQSFHVQEWKFAELFFDCFLLSITQPSSNVPNAIYQVLNIKC